MQMHSYFDTHLPIEAKIIERRQESFNIFTLLLSPSDKNHHRYDQFHPGQFNMIYLFGVGEVAISIVAYYENVIQHTIRAVGRVTHALELLKVGDTVGIRGPFGNPWPLEQAKGKDVIIISGGLGCAPTISVINFILAKRDLYGELKILQGVKHSDDFIFKKQFTLWTQSPRTEVHIAVDIASKNWPWKIGRITEILSNLELKLINTIAMICGPEMMIHKVIDILLSKKIQKNNIYVSMERNMECGIRQCGHCQYGGLFVCKDGPIFSYPQIQSLFSVPGF